MKFGDFYNLAKLGGEGWGTAYEYRVKWEVLEKFFGERRIERVLIAGLPEKYGLSMDFLAWVRMKKAKVVVLDEREEKVERLKRVVRKEWPDFRKWIDIKCRSMLTIDTVGRFDLVLSCEVLQRILKSDREKFLKKCLMAAKRGAFFVPNKENENHAKISGLETLSLEEFFELASKAGLDKLEEGYIDMPPFAPGVRLEEKQRENRVLGAALSVGLEVWARMERYFPEGFKKKKAHLVYAVLK